MHTTREDRWADHRQPTRPSAQRCDTCRVVLRDAPCPACHPAVSVDVVADLRAQRGGHPV